MLEPYKYSGYPMLIKTIQLEIEDAKAFSKEAALLPSACELCYHTVNTSALNAEELRRENGIEVWFSLIAIYFFISLSTFKELFSSYRYCNLHFLVRLILLVAQVNPGMCLCRFDYEFNNFSTLWLYLTSLCFIIFILFHNFALPPSQSRIQ